MFYCEEVSIIVKVECKHAIFHYFLYIVSCTSFKKNQETSFSFFHRSSNIEQNREWKTAFSYYITTTRPRGHQQKVITNMLKAAWLFSCNFTHDNTKDIKVDRRNEPNNAQQFQNKNLVPSQAIFHVFLFFLFLLKFVTIAQKLSQARKCRSF